MTARLSHLARRGAVYYVRFRIPSQLVVSLQMVELRRSLGTKDYATARRRCIRATNWFEITTAWLKGMETPDRSILEEAANAYFAALEKDINQPRSFNADHFDEEIAYQVERSEVELRRLDTAIVLNDYDTKAQVAARHMLSQMNLDFDALDPASKVTAMSYAARAERQQMRYLLSGLKLPPERFVSDDTLFGTQSQSAPAPVDASAPPVATPLRHPEITLARGIEMYTDYQVKKGWQGSMRDESLRVLRWMQEEIEPGTPVSAVTSEQMRSFRNCMMELGSGAQGRKLALRDRLVGPGQQPLAFVTRERYWRFARSFFSWFRSEYNLADPTDGLLFEGGRNELRKSPTPFSEEEVRKFLSTPLFAGYKSVRRLSDFGDCHIRGGHWWSALLMMYTGMRAGDIAQLLPTDFQFDHAVPHLLVQPGPLPEGGQKRSKFGPRTHLVPLHPALLALGLQPFVEARAKQKAARRVLYEIGLGGTRMSNGMTKFWGRYLQKFDLYQHGRATHVYRHTVAARLRSANVMDEDIGAVLGHAKATVTGQYGGDQDLQRKVATLQRLNYGFDVAAALGGSYDHKQHG